MLKKSNRSIKIAAKNQNLGPQQDNQGKQGDKGSFTFLHIKKMFFGNYSPEVRFWLIPLSRHFI